MLDYCSQDSTATGGYPASHHQNPSPVSMSSLLNMSTNMNMDCSAAVAASRQSAFVLSNPPLAALHNMTETKVPPANMLQTQGAYAQTTLKHFGLGQQTPHGIQDILSRTLPHGLSIPRINTSAGVYYPSQSRLHKPLADLPGRTPIYWPGVIPPGGGQFRPQGKACTTAFTFTLILLMLNSYMYVHVHFVC